LIHIVVCLHAPPETGGRPVGRYDAMALAHALSLAGRGGAMVTALLAGTAVESGPLERALAAGADHAVRVAGDDFGVADFHTVGHVLANAIRHLGADLVLTGARSDDDGLGAVPAAVARHLGLPFVSAVEDIALGDGRAEITVRGGGRKRRLRVVLPAVLAIAAGPPTGISPPDRVDHSTDIQLMPLADSEATVVRRRSELVGRSEPAPRRTERVTSAAAFIAALRRGGV
jgi:electron transfer flavoprotein alpha/beta subunit